LPKEREFGKEGEVTSLEWLKRHAQKKKKEGSQGGAGRAIHRGGGKCLNDCVFGN